MQAIPKHLAAPLAGLALLLVHAGASAAQLCGDPGCSISLDFPNGGSISAPQGATLTFSPGGALSLGENGAIDPGDDSSTAPVPAGSAAPDMSGGGSIVLGPNGVITFGNGGSLASGDSGQIEVAADTRMSISGAHAANIVSPGSVNIGNIDTAGEVNLTAQNSITQTGAGTPIDFVMADGDDGSSLLAQAGTDLMFGNVNARNATINGGAGSGGSSSSGSSSGGGSSAGVCISISFSLPGSCDQLVVPPAGVIGSAQGNLPPLNTPSIPSILVFSGGNVVNFSALAPLLSSFHLQTGTDLSSTQINSASSSTINGSGGGAFDIPALSFLLLSALRRRGRGRPIHWFPRPATAGRDNRQNCNVTLAL